MVGIRVGYDDVDGGEEMDVSEANIFWAKRASSPRELEFLGPRRALKFYHLFHAVNVNKWRCGNTPKCYYFEVFSNGEKKVDSSWETHTSTSL